MRGAWAAWACALAVLATAGLAALHVANVPDAAHDAGVARALGLDAQPSGALDAALGALLGWVPIGTRAARAAMTGALVAAGAAATLWVLARAVLAGCADAPRAGPAVAAIAALCATLSPAWQLESATAGGSVAGALLALLPLALLAGADAPEGRPPWRLAVLLLALAIGQDPLAGACSLAGCAALVAAGPVARRRFAVVARAEWRVLAGCAAAGLVPGLLALARTRAAGASVLEALASSGAAERGTSAFGSPGPSLQRELGPILGALAIGGAVLGLVTPRARALGAGLLALAATGLACGWAGAALGPTRFGAPVLAALGCACVLAGCSMQALVRAIAGSHLPLARASAAMVLVLELVAPVDEADEALTRCAARARGSGPTPEEPPAAWDDAAWGTLPPRSVVLLTEPRIARRAAAARATGALRGDLAIVPTFARGAVVSRVLARDALLVPLWRDLAFAGVPTEASLSSLASSRPVVMAFEPGWGRVLGKHLVPVSLLDRFETEPRGASDRRRALDALTRGRERLARAVVRDPELSDATAWLLRRRALDLAASGDRDLVGRAVEDLHAFAPDDPSAAQIVGKMVLGR